MDKKTLAVLVGVGGILLAWYFNSTNQSLLQSIAGRIGGAPGGPQNTGNAPGAAPLPSVPIVTGTSPEIVVPITTLPDVSPNLPAGWWL